MQSSLFEYFYNSFFNSIRLNAYLTDNIFITKSVWIASAFNLCLNEQQRNYESIITNFTFVVIVCLFFFLVRYHIHIFITANWFITWNGRRWRRHLLFWQILNVDRFFELNAFRTIHFVNPTEKVSNKKVRKFKKVTLLWVWNLQEETNTGNGHNAANQEERTRHCR